MQKSSTQLNLEDFLKFEKRNNDKLKKVTIKSILNFSRSFQVKASKNIHLIEYNLS